MGVKARRQRRVRPWRSEENGAAGTGPARRASRPPGGCGSAPAKGPKPGLTLDRIVDAAVGLAASEGLGGGLHGPGRQGPRRLDDVALPLRLRQGRAVRPDAGGRHGAPPRCPRRSRGAGGRRSASWAWALRELYHRNLWALRIPTTAPPATPNSVAWMERGLACLRDTNLSEGEKISVLMLVTGFVRNEARLSADLAAAALRTGDGTEQSMASWARLLRKVTDPERFPAVTAALAVGELDTPGGPDDEFVFGLARILDGIEALVRA